MQIYISYKIDTWSRHLSTDLTLDNYLFGAVKLTKNADPDKYRYSGYCIGFNTHSQFLWSYSSWGKNIISGIDMSSSVHVKIIKKVSLVLGKGST